MSQNSIRTALSTALAAITPDLATAWENVPFVPTADPYQIVNVLFGEPENQVLGVTEYWEIGYMQVRLMYPKDKGAFLAGARAELTRSALRRGYSFASGGITVNISKTPTISGGQIEDDRFAIIVKVPFYAHITI